MIGEFVAWWAARMGELLPDALRGGARAEPDALVIDATAANPFDPPATLPLLQRRRRRERPAGVLALGQKPAKARPAGPVILRLPPDMLLDRTAQLPLAAERDLERVVGYEMDRMTPFAAEEVFWAAAPRERDRAHGRIAVALSLVPRAGVQDLLGALALVRHAPMALEVADSAGVPRLIALSHARSGADRRRRAATVALAGLCAALAVAALAIPVLRQSMAMQAAEERIAAAQPRVTEAEQLRRRIADNTTGADAIAAESARLGDTLQALAALTDILPDDTHLTDLKLRQRKLTMNGQSAGAARLIAALSADPTLKDPAFMAPVTRANDGRGDQFAIRAELGP